MTLSPVTTPQVRNLLLLALPSELLTRMLPKLQPVTLTVRDVLIVPDKPIEAVWFVESGIVSLVTTLDDGVQAEVGLVGRDGVVGMSLILGIDTAFPEAFVQAAGTALRMEADAFRRFLKEEPLQNLLNRYREVMNDYATQTAACNGRHDLEQRLARWLLMAHDRSDGDDLIMTQEFLGLMLCVYRPSITAASRTLQRSGIIRSTRGIITIIDRDGLEETSCDCYRAVRQRSEKVLPFSLSRLP